MHCFQEVNKLPGAMSNPEQPSSTTEDIGSDLENENSFSRSSVSLKEVKKPSVGKVSEKGCSRARIDLNEGALLQDHDYTPYSTPSPGQQNSPDSNFRV